MQIFKNYFYCIVFGFQPLSRFLKCSVLAFKKKKKVQRFVLSFYLSELHSIRIKLRPQLSQRLSFDFEQKSTLTHTTALSLSLSLSDPEQKIHKPHGTVSSSVQYLLSTYFFLVWYPLLSLAVMLSLSFFCLSACHKFVTFYCAF